MGGGKMFCEEIKWYDIKVGEEYLYQEGSDFSGIVKIIENTSTEEFFVFKLHVLKVTGSKIADGYKTLLGTEFEVSANKETFHQLSHYLKISFKDKDCMPSYFFANNPENKNNDTSRTNTGE